MNTTALFLYSLRSAQYDPYVSLTALIGTGKSALILLKHRVLYEAKALKLGTFALFSEMRSFLKISLGSNINQLTPKIHYDA